jgi:hypothetical protein
MRQVNSNILYLLCVFVLSLAQDICILYWIYDRIEMKTIFAFYITESTARFYLVEDCHFYN